MKTYRLLLLPCTAILLHASCLGTYNPFNDSANAGAVISWSSMSDGDSVPLFRAESLQIIVLVKEQVDSFSLRCSANRLWSANDTTIDSRAFEREPFALRLSFADTGWQPIILTSMLRNSTRRSDTLNVYVHNPLHQDTLWGNFGEALTLQTPAVGDTDVFYHWSFGGATPVSSPLPTTTATITTAAPDGRGELWVSDNRRRSLSVPFTFIMNDATPPTIECISAGYQGGDTLYTSDTVFYFGVRITDRGNHGVDSASINGTPFDLRFGNEYHTILTNLNRYSAHNPLVLSILALDDYRFANVSRHTFYIVFGNAYTSGPSLLLRITDPAESTTVHSAPFWRLRGLLQSLTNDTSVVALNITSTDTTYQQRIKLGSSDTLWEQTIALTPGDNHLSISITDTTRTTSYAQQQRTITYQPDTPDTLGPAITSLTADNQPAAGYFSRTSPVIIRCRIADAQTFVKEVYLNDTLIHPQADGQWYLDTLQLQHRLGGTPLHIIARDSAGNASEQRVLLFLNRKPVFSRTPRSTTVARDSLYRDTLSAIDPDGDTLTFTKHEGPQSLSISPAGLIQWQPDSADTGLQRLSVRLWDGYQAVFATWQIFVSTLPQPQRLRFLIDEEDFPAYLEAERDTLKIDLSHNGESGKGPYSYTVRMVDKDTMLLNHSSQTQLQWAPGAEAVGIQRMVVVVEDGFGGADTLYPRMVIVTPNHPCSLSVSHSLPVDSMGRLSFGETIQSAQLRFGIVDADNRLFDKHAITIYQARSRLTSSIDSAQADSFRVAIDARAFDGLDTLIVTARDRGEQTDTVVLLLNYGVGPDSVVLHTPSGAATQPLTLSWSGYDRDADSLRYTVWLGTSPTQLQPQSPQRSSTLSLPQLQTNRRWYWQVEAADWKRSVRSPLSWFDL